MPVSDERVACCPVCGSPFRGRAGCPRCGADLRAVMHVQIAAWRLRNRARGALRSGDAACARALATEAIQLHATPAGRDLFALAGVVAAADAFAADQARATQLRALEDEAREAIAGRAAAIEARDQAVAALQAQKQFGAADVERVARPPARPTPALAEGSTAATEPESRHPRSMPPESRSQPAGPPRPTAPASPASPASPSRPSRPAPARPSPWFRRLWSLWRGRRTR